jgi:hypothetical protein
MQELTLIPLARRSVSHAAKFLSASFLNFSRNLVSGRKSGKVVGTEFKVMQELMRHSSLRSTIDIYTQAVTRVIAVKALAAADSS